MKAAYLEATGTPDVIQYGEIPTPTPGPNEVRVKVAAVSVNPIDTYIRGGAVAMALPKPFVPGCDFAGTVDAIGSAVTKLRVGERVWGSNQGLLGRQGTFAEFCCPNEEFVYSSPEGVSDEDLAASALVGITAHLGLFMSGKIQKGEWLFINGGAGGVGSLVVQMAKAVGARVITTVGSEKNAAKACELGAEFVLNYKTDDISARVKEITGGTGVHLFFETQREPDYDKMVDLVRPRGRIVVMAGRVARPHFPHGPFYVKGLTLSGYAMFNIPADEQRACAADISRWLADGSLKANIGARFKLSESAKAHQLQEESTLKGSGGLSGKIVLTPG